MKKILLFFGVLAITASLQAQDPLSGVYGYSIKAPVDAPVTESDRGPSATLILVKMDNEKYRFWLDITKGWPSYAVGETDGTITFKNDTASFDNTFEDASGNCILKFKKNGNTISISSDRAAFNCGFGNGVVATGEYVKLEKQPELNSAWLRKEYPNAPVVIVAVDKAEIYQDENALRSFPKKQYFSKGDRLFNITETETTIYTEFIQASGQFIYGWIRKSAIKSEAQK